MALSIRHSQVPVVAADHLLGCAPDLHAALGRERSFSELTRELAATRAWPQAYAEAVLHRYLALGRILAQHPDGLGVPPTVLCIVAAAVPVDDVQGFDPALLAAVATEFMARLGSDSINASPH